MGFSLISLFLPFYDQISDNFNPRCLELGMHTVEYIFNVSSERIFDFQIQFFLIVIQMLKLEPQKNNKLKNNKKMFKDFLEKNRSDET